MAVNASDCSTKARRSSRSEAVFLTLAPREELSSSFKSAAGRQCETGRQMCRKNGSPPVMQLGGGDQAPVTSRGTLWLSLANEMWAELPLWILGQRRKSQNAKKCHFSILSSPLAVPRKEWGESPDPSQKSSDLESSPPSQLILHEPKGKDLPLCYLSSHSRPGLASHTARDIDCWEQAKQTQGNHERIQTRVNEA